MPYVQTEDSRMVRDIDSKGLVATNIAELRKHRATRSAAEKLLNQKEHSEQRFKDMDARLDRCESLLHELVRHVSTLVAKSADSISE